MTKEKLKRYRRLLSELELLKRQLEKLEPEFVSDSVNGSDSEFPYTNHKMHVEGYDLNSYKRKVSRLNKRIINKMNELVEEKDSLIEFIYNLEDSEARQIFIYRYIDGLAWKEIAAKMNYGTSTVRLKHDNLIRNLKD
ncbi:RNA polymerase subunit sigma-24 [Clostridium sp. NSJ-49]|uniref:RNA polymerase subunit sigma-24 n=1 Tax=Clostridium sp. NSJ-49 TaxID=2763034 RepID=UPI00164C1230|nr:RNA polymerase subunit sigma-24 [Clostridium sp. NSJ-49]MBC5624996.1 RNA polymerase subunit sigma-24 [Clostridium sp. NSJ-49]